jgi:hypothetical protein
LFWRWRWLFLNQFSVNHDALPTPHFPKFFGDWIHAAHCPTELKAQGEQTNTYKHAYNG